MYMNLEYIILFILGGILICLLHYFSKMNNTLASAIVPTIPVLFITGYFMLHYYHGNVFSYSKKALKCIIIYFVFLLFLILSLYYLKNELQCIALSIMMLLLIYSLVYKYL
jgi:hypothetical protein